MFYKKSFHSLNRFCIVLIALAMMPLSARATPAYVGDMQTMVTGPHDTFVAIAQQYSLGYVELIAANPGIDPWLPGDGTVITLPTRHIVPDGPHEGIVVNVGEMRLYYYPEANGTPETFPIGMGRDGYVTPMGSTTVVRKAANPSWYRTASERADKPELPAVIPPGPDNPLGAYALYLGWPGYLMHGTDDERSVGREASRGCIRMYAPAIKELYEKVPVGTKVTVVDQPVKFARIDGELYVSIFPSKAQAMDLEDHNSTTPEAPKDIAKTILAAAGPDTNRLDWDAIRTAANERRGYPVQITR
jgi:L,D-transpeptidase ErfK/SrfK